MLTLDSKFSIENTAFNSLSPSLQKEIEGEKLTYKEKSEKVKLSFCTAQNWELRSVCVEAGK